MVRSGQVTCWLAVERKMWCVVVDRKEELDCVGCLVRVAEWNLQGN